MTSEREEHRQEGRTEKQKREDFCEPAICHQREIRAKGCAL